VRRRYVQFAIAMAWLAFGAFLSFVACLLGRVAHTSDNQAAATLAIFSTAQGIGHGIHARLTLQNSQSREFISG
jgi:hypothetical protein